MINYQTLPIDTEIETEFKMPIARRKSHFIVLKTKDGYVRTEHATINPNKSLWKLVVEYINSLPVDHIFTRKELHYAVYNDDTAKWQLKKGDVSTVDNYRALLCKTPYVETTKRPGRYIKRHKIPEEATLTKLRNFAKCKDYKKWFIPYEDWIK